MDEFDFDDFSESDDEYMIQIKKKYFRYPSLPTKLLPNRCYTIFNCQTSDYSTFSRFMYFVTCKSRRIAPWLRQHAYQKTLFAQ